MSMSFLFGEMKCSGISDNCYTVCKYTKNHWIDTSKCEFYGMYVNYISIKKQIKKQKQNKWLQFCTAEDTPGYFQQGS